MLTSAKEHKKWIKNQVLQSNEPSEPRIKGSCHPKKSFGKSFKKPGELFFIYVSTYFNSLLHLFFFVSFHVDVNPLAILSALLTALARSVTTSQSNISPLGCGGMRDCDAFTPRIKSGLKANLY